MKAVTVQQNQAHVTSWQDRMGNQGAFGEESYVLDIGQKMAAEVYSNYEVRIRDGALVHQGCLAVIQKGTYDAVTIQNGTQGMKRVDLIVARYTKNAETQAEDLEWVVIVGTPDASSPSVPSYMEGDIQDGDLTVDMPMYQVHLDGINIEEVTAVFTTLQTMQEMQGQLSSLNSNLNKFTQRIGSIAFSAGSAVRTPNGTSVSMLSLADLNSRFGVTDCSNFNTAVFFANGDSGANGAHIEGATYQNGAWYAVFDRAVTTNIRINFLAVRWNLS